MIVNIKVAIKVNHGELKKLHLMLLESLVTSTHLRLFTTFYDSSSRGSSDLFDVLGHCTSYTEMHKQTHKIKILKKKMIRH